MKVDVLLVQVLLLKSLNNKLKTHFGEFFLTKNFEILCIKRTEIRDIDEDFGKRNIVVRYNSMPTKRFFIFTHKPKYYPYPLFQYKSDFRGTK